MSRKIAQEILNSHDIVWEENGEWLQILDCGTIHGVPCQRWIKCPKRMVSLLRWLGYGENE